MKLPHDHGSNEQHIAEYMPDMEDIQAVAAAMKQLGDPLRLRIFWLLCHCEACVANIAAVVEMSSPAVSHHLRILKADNLVVTRRSGKEMLYSAADTPLVAFLHKAIEQLASITCPSAS